MSACTAEYCCCLLSLHTVSLEVCMHSGPIASLAEHGSHDLGVAQEQQQALLSRQNFALHAVLPIIIKLLLSV